MVRAMESGVEWVDLGCRGEVSLDIRALTQYSGQGKCEVVKCHKETASKYREEFKSWAQRINWRFGHYWDTDYIIWIVKAPEEDQEEEEDDDEGESAEEEEEDYERA